MLGKIKPNFQQNLFQTRLTDLINLGHPLVKLANEVAWNKMELEFENLYSEQGRPSIPIRKIAGLLLLKEMFKESDESVVEHWGSNQNYVQSAMHSTSSFGGTINKGGRIIPTASTAYHIYSLDWYANKMVFSIDGIVHYTYQPATINADTWPFDKEQYLLLNLAIQSSIYPSFTQGAMEIDYVRVYQEKTLSTNENATSKDTIRLSPNPVEDVLTLHIPADLIGAKISIVSMQGQEVANFVSKDEILTINTSKYSSGIYLIQFTTKKESVSYKIIKK